MENHEDPWSFFKRNDEKGGISWNPTESHPPNLILLEKGSYRKYDFYKSQDIPKEYKDAYFNLNLGSILKIGYPIGRSLSTEVILTYKLPNNEFFTPEKLFFYMWNFYLRAPSEQEIEILIESGDIQPDEIYEDIKHKDILDSSQTFKGFTYDLDTDIHHLNLFHF